MQLCQARCDVIPLAKVENSTCLDILDVLQRLNCWLWQPCQHRVAIFQPRCYEGQEQPCCDVQTDCLRIWRRRRRCWKQTAATFPICCFKDSSASSITPRSCTTLADCIVLEMTWGEQSQLASLDKLARDPNQIASVLSPFSLKRRDAHHNKTWAVGGFRQFASNSLCVRKPSTSIELYVASKEMRFYLAAICIPNDFFHIGNEFNWTKDGPLGNAAFDD